MSLNDHLCGRCGQPASWSICDACANEDALQSISKANLQHQQVLKNVRSWAKRNAAALGPQLKELSQIIGDQ